MKNLTIIIALLALINCGHFQMRGDNSDTTNLNGLKQGDIKYEKWFEPATLDTTLIFSDSVKLTLRHTDSILINEYYLDPKTIDSITKPHQNRHIEALEIEKYLFKTFSQFAKRDKNGLNIKLDNGEWKLLTLNPMADESDNTFEYYFKDFGYYSIRVQWGEGNGYKLVNQIDGSETNLFGRPYFSPNGQFVISINMDIEAGYSQNGFQLFKNENGKLKLLGYYEPEGWGPFSARWIDNNKLVLKNQTVEIKNDNMFYIDFYAEIKIKNGG
jgi:hypothetical protein